MPRPRVLFICGTVNAATMMYAISKHLDNCDCYFAPYYADGLLGFLTKLKLLEFTSLGGEAKRKTIEYLKDKNVDFDFAAANNTYNLVVTYSDLILQKNIRQYPIIHVQEGMTEPENLVYKAVKFFKLPRYLANTSMTGVSNAYEKFCIMGEGWKNIFLNKGVQEDKIEVTGLPGYDNVKEYSDNDFPYKDYVLAATSALRERGKREDRAAFIKKAIEVADGSQLIFKLHPVENQKRAIREIKKYAPSALIFTTGNTNHMMANCHTLVTKYSTVVLVAAAMGKKIVSDFADSEIAERIPLQTNGTSAERIADICRGYL